MKCPQTIVIPPLTEDKCGGNRTSTDCTIYEEAITYLSLPENSTATEVIDALLSSLADARDRIGDLESGELDNTTLLHTTGNETKAGTLTATQFNISALNTAPATATSTGTVGEIRFTAGFLYLCTATNTWVRAALTTF